MQSDLSNNSNVTHVRKGAIEYVQFPCLEKYKDILIHCFTTRRGGVSSGECESLNLSFNRNDLRENVEENFRRLGNALGIKPENMVLSSQVHDNRVRIVTEEDRGKGLAIKSDITGYDGLVTNRREVAIVTFYADCVPVFLFDSVKRVIALSHSGWRGTVKNIAGETIRIMSEAFETQPSCVDAAIGPSIGVCCFEVGDEVYREFMTAIPWSESFCKKAGSDKWFIDLQGIIKRSLMIAGVHEDRICSSGVCTKCRNDMFFSHRGDKGRTGSLAAIMQLK